MPQADRELLDLLARKNWRGIPPDVLVSEIQDLQDKLEMLARFPDEAIGFECPKAYPPGEWIEDHRYFWRCSLENLQGEIIRRRTMVVNPTATNDPEIIQTIKTNLPIADVIEWYTEVFYSSRIRWKFRCNLHGDGEDKDPSGVIYIDENRFWCYVCNKGGDIFDAVEAWEHCDLSVAIAKLARYLGLNNKPLVKPNRLPVKGGASL